MAVEKETEGREDIVPLDNSILEPSDTYAEKGSVAVFQAYHPDATAYQWETETEAGEWEIVSPGAVMEKTDELRRNISLLEVAADKEKTIRCQMSVEDGPALNYTAELHILSAPIASIGWIQCGDRKLCEGGGDSSESDLYGWKAGCNNRADF